MAFKEARLDDITKVTFYSWGWTVVKCACTKNYCFFYDMFPNTWERFIVTPPWRWFDSLEKRLARGQRAHRKQHFKIESHRDRYPRGIEKYIN